MQHIEVEDGMSSIGKIIKRSFDIIASLLGLVLLSPIYGFVFLILKCQGGKPAIYAQERIGMGGRPFLIYKFRTMTPNFESDGIPKLTANDMADDLTPFCRFLRVHHLDELPQLWNVLKGDMSFVGPRPERLFFIKQIMKERPDYVFLYQIRPGLTSLATLKNGYTDTISKMIVRLDMDLEYLKNRSVWFDLKIIFTTISFILKGKKF